MKNFPPYFIFFSKQVFIIITLVFCLQNVQAEDKKNIVVTIKPLQGLVLAIAGDSVNLQRLLPDYASLHDYHFRPSDIRKLNKADLIFRIDEEMERFLTPLLKNLKDSKTISLADDPNIQQLAYPPQKNQHTESHLEEEEEEHENKHAHHHHGNQDLHIWMSPYNGIIMAQKISDELTQISPQHRLIYQKNLSILIKKINQFSSTFQTEANVLHKKPYLVFHDGWHHFSHAFHLNKLATINLHADIQPGIKTLYQTRRKIKQYHAVCLFSQPLFRPKTIAVLIEDIDIKTAEIDALGSHLKITPDLYLNLLRYTAQQIKNCLS